MGSTRSPCDRALSCAVCNAIEHGSKMSGRHDDGEANTFEGQPQEATGSDPNRVTCPILRPGRASPLL